MIAEDSESTISKRFLTNMREYFGIKGVHEFLMFLPNGYLDFRKPVLRALEALKADAPVYMKAIVKYHPKTHSFTAKAKGGEAKERQLCSITLFDGVSQFQAAVFFGVKEVEKLREGDVVHIYGKMIKKDGRLEMQNMAIVPKHEQGTIVAQYKGKEKKVSPVTVGINMNVVIGNYLNDNVENLCNIFALTEQEIVQNAQIPFNSLSRMFMAIHRPKDDVDMARAEDAVAKLNGFYAVNMSLKAEEFSDVETSKVDVPVDLLKELTSNITLKQGDEERKITLTQDQKQCIWNICKDLLRVKPTRHLIMGDVGCGKTFAYMIPAVAAQRLGRRVCILMPNILLAQQVVNEINGTYPGTETLLVLGRKRSKNAPPVVNPIVVGTSAIIGWAKGFNDGYPFDLVIIDEQQKVGMSHKNAILSSHTNLIEASATPIPRTLAHAVYGGKRVSYIENCPVEKEISSIIIADDEKKIGMQKLRDWINKGRQVAVLYPLKQPEIPVYELILPISYEFNNLKQMLSEAGARKIRSYDELSKSKFSEATDDGYYLIRFVCVDECIQAVRELISAIDTNEEIILMSDDADDDEKERNIRSVEEAYDTWNRIFPGQVLKIHGGMPTAVKLEAAKNAKSGKWPIIITSTVIEIGLTMPNLFAMLVVEADNLGASTLHQLRGRLVRLGGFGEFIMHTASPRSAINPETLKRLQILVDFKKGSEIAEADMRLRGFGDLSKSAIRQSGSAKGLFHGMKVTPEHVESFLAACMKAALAKDKNIVANASNSGR
jgi:RecG-like helicase